MLKCFEKINWAKTGIFAAGCTAAFLRAKDCVMKTAATVQENAGDIYAEAKQQNEERAAAAEAEVVEDVEEEAEADTTEE